MLRDLLQGKPFGHPLHPAVVHFPIGLFIFSLLLDIATYFLPQPGLIYRGTRYTLGIGVGMGLLAALPGFADWLDIRSDHPSKKTATTHMLLNLLAVALFGLNFALRMDGNGSDGTPPLQLGLSVIGVGLISVSGYLGGKMVYDDGIGAGRHRRFSPTPKETIHVSSGGSQDGWTEVGQADLLQEGETLRVDFDGYVLSIARLDGQLYAFQEFCTHRYGPLSEGSLRDHQVECPWHRSCFDIRTGKVTQGPAKVDLKIFPVTIRDGKILLRTP
jgi:nitrite reductase/ring-hydroxylating ferredoxin subunit/uncharacterized membrane protein